MIASTPSFGKTAGEMHGSERWAHNVIFWKTGAPQACGDRANEPAKRQLWVAIPAFADAAINGEVAPRAAR